MDYDKRIFVYLILLALSLIIGLIVVFLIFPIETPEISSQSFTGCVYRQVGIPYYQEEKSLGIIHLDDYSKIIFCMVEIESSGDPEAYNPCDVDGREKWGILQFGDIEWQEWCVDKYGLQDDIYNSINQLNCADRMIRDGQHWRWPSFWKCL